MTNQNFRIFHGTSVLINKLKAMWLELFVAINYDSNVAEIKTDNNHPMG
jgi:hypothetical protein